MGHPDKMADQISDAVLDAMLAQDKYSRVACETMVTTGIVIVAGEITTDAWVNIPKIVRDTIVDIGYTDSAWGIDGNTCAVVTSIDEQSPDIKRGVDANNNKEQGAGDQGMMFGFACDETPEYMPMAIMLANKLMDGLVDLRKKGKVKWLRPDSKGQVTVEYHDGKPARIHTVVVSTQHDPDVSQKEIRKTIIEQLIKPAMPKGMIDDKTVYHVNPTGRFVVGGPHGDCGLTGRKIIVDTYGGYGRHGGGAFSGKDPSKVDRSAAYAARYIAKNVVAAGLARKCEVQLAYAIGIAEPLAIHVDTFGTGTMEETLIEKLIREIFPIKPYDIITKLKLLRPIYRKTAYHGHFGRNDPDFTWEKLDKVAILKRKAAALNKMQRQ
jgi:S-adenosylmethionine synthetase